MSFERYVPQSMILLGSQPSDDASRCEVTHPKFYDVVVIGGGLLGAIIARTSALNSFSTLLISQNDFLDTPLSEHVGVIPFELVKPWWKKLRKDTLHTMRGISAPHLVGHSLVTCLDNFWFRKKIILPWWNAPRLVMEQVVSARDEGATVMNYVRPISSSLALDGRIKLNLEPAVSSKEFYVIASVVVDATETIPKITSSNNGWYTCERYIVETGKPKSGLLVLNSRDYFVVIDSSDELLRKESLLEVQVIKPVTLDEFYRVDINDFLCKRKSDLASYGYHINKVLYDTPKISYLVFDSLVNTPIKWSFGTNISQALNPVAAHTYPERAAFSFLRQLCETSNINRRLVPITERALPGSGLIKDESFVAKANKITTRFGAKGLSLNSLAEQELYARTNEFAKTNDDVARRFSSYCL